MGVHGAVTLTSFLLLQTGRKESQRASFTSSAASSPFKWTTDGNSGPCVPILIGTPRNLTLSVDFTFSILCPWALRDRDVDKAWEPEPIPEP